MGRLVRGEDCDESTEMSLRSFISVRLRSWFVRVGEPSPRSHENFSEGTLPRVPLYELSDQYVYYVAVYIQLAGQNDLRNCRLRVDTSYIHAPIFAPTTNPVTAVLLGRVIKSQVFMQKTLCYVLCED